ncbi:hypothetical protein OBBRIDRAFT_423822 [Obba rivulosa]|uniref:Uncharacterized protein n=1 Tax=Obba rivulosa TaxID=1052685 RepID=A0A8E2AX16_9APHY|nr:hypothetical protein OBBRIDRAFT_423822 [Obba rivulosa]
MVFAVVMDVVLPVISAVRVYALSSGSIFLAGVVCATGMVFPGMNIWANLVAVVVGRKIGQFPSTLRSIHHPTSHAEQHMNIATATCRVVSKGIPLVVTCYKIYAGVTPGVQVRTPIARALLISDFLSFL